MIGFSPRCCSPTLWTRRAGPRRSATVTGMRLLDAHDAVVRVQLDRFRGREVNTSGDGFLAMFDGPQRAIRCAMAIRDAVQALGIEVRAGLHTGECEVRGDDIGGIAVHIGARVSALAGPNDVLVSSTLRDLVIGSGLEFEDRGAHRAQGRARRVASLRGRLSVAVGFGETTPKRASPTPGPSAAPQGIGRHPPLHFFPPPAGGASRSAGRDEVVAGDEVG